MKLSEILDHVNEQLDNKSALIEGDADELWSDAAIVRFLNEGQRILARRAWVIVEHGIAPAGVIVLATGKVLYPLHSSVLKVFDATPSTQDYPLGRSDDAQIKGVSAASGLDAFEVGEAASLAADATTGTTLAFATDAGSRTVRVYPAPTTTENGVKVALKVARMPIMFLTLDNTDAEPETPREWDMSLADYAVGRCLLRPNVDTQSRADGRELVAGFLAAVKEARQERVRAEVSSTRWAFSSTTALLR